MHVGLLDPGNEAGLMMRLYALKKENALQIFRQN